MSKGSRECLRGPLAPYVPGFRDELSQVGYSKSAAKRQLQLMACLSAWLEDENLEVFELATPRVGRLPGAPSTTPTCSRRERSCPSSGICGE